MIKRIDKLSFGIAIILWLIINVSGIHSMFFREGDRLTIVIIKGIHLFFLWFIISIMKTIFVNRKNKVVKEGIIIGCTYFIILAVLLRLVWPGIWSWDDIHVASNAQVYNLSPWQHFFSGLFQIMCLQTLPLAAGVIIIQIFFASIIVGYCVSTISNLLINRTIYRIISQILLTSVTLMPPVLEYILSGFRMGIYSYIELLLIIILFNSYLRKKQFSLYNLITVTILTIIVASWRTEAIYYLVCIPILLLFIIKKNGVSYKKYYTYLSILASILMVLIVGKYNNHLIGSNNYSITATISPVSELVKKADIEKDKKELDLINTVLDIEFIYKKPELGGEGYYWGGAVYDDYSDDDYSKYLKGYIGLAVKYPNVILNSMWDMFFKSSGVIVEDGYSVQRTAVGATSGGALNLFEDKVWRGIKSEYKWAFNEEIRASVIKKIACFTNDCKVTPLYYICWNLLIPLVLITLAIIYKLIKREWFMVFLILTVLGRAPLIFVTSAAPYIMYYLSVYLISYFLSIIVIIQTLNDIKNKKKAI